MKAKKKIVVCMLALALVLSVVSAQAGINPSRALAPAAEVQTVGGYSCATIWGFGLAMGVATLSGCGILCATAAWYTLALLYKC